MNSSLLLIWRDRDFRTQVEPVRESAHSDTVTFFYGVQGLTGTQNDLC